MTDGLYKLGWQLTDALGLSGGLHWEIDVDGELEAWFGERYFVVVQSEPHAFIVSEQKTEDPDFLEDRKAWHTWDAAARDLLERIQGPRS